MSRLNKAKNDDIWKKNDGEKTALPKGRDRVKTEESAVGQSRTNRYAHHKQRVGRIDKAIAV